MLINFLSVTAEAPSFDWSPYLITGIPGIIALVAVLLGKFFDGRNARRALNSEQQNRHEPTWKELVTENRDLRTELDGLRDRFDEFQTAQKNITKAQDGKISALEIDRELSDRRELLLYRHTKALREHILGGFPPPPPRPPAELVEWFESFDDTENPLMGLS